MPDDHGPPAPAAERDADPPAAHPARELLTPPPDVAAMFAQADDLLEGLSAEEKLEAARTFYIDAAGTPRARSLNLRPL